MEYGILEYSFFAVFVVIALLIDMLNHKEDKPVSVASAALWSAIWVGTGLAFALLVAWTHSGADASLFLTGYVLEKSLSVDNLFVIMAIFSSFAIADKYQHRVLYYGILGAIVLRMVFVAAGSSILMVGGKYALAFFGVFVLWSAWKMWKDNDGINEEIDDYTQHFSVKWTKKFFKVHPKLVGHDFFTKIDGLTYVTPLFLCLVCVEMADVMFAFDSVPAVIAVTQKPFLVYTSNIFAILGLRSLYFLLAAAKRYLCHLEKAVIAILVFIGAKMLIDVAGIVHITPQISLIVVMMMLCCGIAGSFIWPEAKEIEV